MSPLPTGTTEEERLELLRSFTEAAPGWAVWKNADSFLAGRGDVDSVCPRAEWPQLTRRFADWASARGFDGVIECPHLPGALLLAAVDRAGGRVLEVDVWDTLTYRGAPLVSAAGLTSLFTDDAREFRRLRAGAEGLLLLHYAALRRGRLDRRALASRRVPELLRADPEGARQAAGLFRSGRRAALAAATAVEEGRWGRRNGLAVEARAFLRALAAPRTLAGRLRFRVVWRRCPVVATGAGRRLAEGEFAGWLATVESTHTLRGSP